MATARQVAALALQRMSHGGVGHRGEECPLPRRPLTFVLLPCLVTTLMTPLEAVRAQQAAPPAPAATTETPAVIVDNNQAQTLLGRPVRSAKGEDLGRVVDV